jgi:hypothetical protein
MANIDPANNAGGAARGGGVPSTPSAATPSSAPAAGVAITGVTAAASGAFAFSLFGDMGLKQMFQSADNTTAILFCTTLFCLIALVILGAGYLVLNNGKPEKTPPSVWIPLSVCATITLGGVFAFLIAYMRDPGATIRAYMGPNSDLSLLNTAPPVAVFLNNDPDNYMIKVGRQNALHLHVGDNAELVLDLRNFYDLRRRLQDLRAQSEGGSDVLGLLKKTCEFVPESSPLHATCSTMSNSDPQRG